jgi:hypothetical protein
MEDLSIPLALNCHGALVSPDHANKSETYYCPGCGDVLLFCFGIKNRKHFKHGENHNCSSEAIEHQLAKQIICDVVREFKKGGKCPVMVVNCEMCGKKIRKGLSNSIIAANREITIGRYRYDVVLDDEVEGQKAIEILNTH